VATGQDVGREQKIKTTAEDPKTDRFVVRKCETIAELKACVALQKEVWNFDDADLVPLRLFVVGQKIGGQTIGAFDRENHDDMVGFVFSIPGARGGRAYLHSHMLAVRAACRDHGLGRRLKLAQREDAIQKGFELIEWTFDPLEIKNAHLNLVRLGAIARRYSMDHYGASSSPLQGGLPTDRLFAEWWLNSKRVVNLLDRAQSPNVQAESRIAVPAEIYTWKASDSERPKATAVQQRHREQFLKAFAEGRAALGYERDAGGNGVFLLGRWDETWSYDGPYADPTLTLPSEDR
jgi:predicted GNAT superfamily acetyltransferase